MQYYKGTKEIQLKHTVVALGKFDGLHRGHQRLFEQLKAYGRQGYQTVVFTFDFHPLSLLSGKPQQLIYTREERRRIVEEMGIDVLVEYPFTQETAHMPAETFVEEVLVRDLDVQVIVVGNDFHFGYQRAGDVNLLKSMAWRFGYRVESCEKVCEDGVEISATQIRDHIREGRMEAATRLLGRPYSISGTVIHGKGNGHKVFSMPTANLAPAPVKLLPPTGVYASMVQVGGELYRGVTNIGFNPTISDHNALRVETFIQDFNRSIYDQAISVRLYTHLRGEQKFDSLEALKAQMALDLQKANAWFDACGC